MLNVPSQIENRVLAYIDRTREELVSFLGDYLRFRSINPDMISDQTTTELLACQEWLAQKLQSWQIFDEVRLIAVNKEQPNVVARINGNGTGPGLLFNGHTDVVPVTEEQRKHWTLGSPWGGEYIDGKVVGRGASDMKGGNVAFLWAIKALAAADVSLAGDLLATVVSGEETGNHKIGVDTLAPNGYVAPFAILAEPSDLEFAPASVGEFYFFIRVEGASTSLSNRHLSIYPQPINVAVPGVNAIDKMTKIQAALTALEREWGVWQRHPLMEPGNMSINFSRIHGGDTYSAMAESCELTGSVLFNPNLTYKEVLGEFQEVIRGVVHSDYWLRDHPPEIVVPYILDHKEPINVSPDHPGAKALARSYRHIRGREPVLTCTTATSDGNYLYANGQTIVTFGPGSPDAGVHGPNEIIEVDKLLAATKIFALMAIEYCGLPGYT